MSLITKIAKTSSLALCVGAAVLVNGQTKTIMPSLRRVSPTPTPAPAPVPAPAPDSPFLKFMPQPLAKSWPDTPTIVIQTVPFNGSFVQPYPGEGPNHCWIPVQSFSIEKDLSTPPNNQQYLVKFTVGMGAWSDKITAAAYSIWPLDYEFHAVSNGKAMVVAARGTMKNVRWYWAGPDQGFMAEATIQSYKYYMGPG